MDFVKLWLPHRQLIFAAPACNQIGREEPVVKVANRNVFYGCR